VYPATTQSATALVNGAELYYEVRGVGEPILFIPGAFGDTAAWERVGGLLAQDYTVISYDRRANSRSPRPAGWTSTSLEQQADDAAGLVKHLGFDSALVYAQSLGGAIGLVLALRHPELVNYAILHEPLLAFLDSDPDAALGPMLEAVTPALEAQDFAGAAAALVRLVAGEQAFGMLPKPQLDRMLANGETLFTVELPGVMATMLGDVTPAVPMTLTVGADSPDFLTAGAATLSKLTGLQVVTMPGAHIPQLTHPDEMSKTVRGLISETCSGRGDHR
jgi:pimeloyl-ACP methyl ester carboxylesterase